MSCSASNTVVCIGELNKFSGSGESIAVSGVRCRECRGVTSGDDGPDGVEGRPGCELVGGGSGGRESVCRSDRRG